MDEENITHEALAEESDGENGAVESVTPSIAKILSKELGKEFKDDESALKAVKDTFSYVGKKQDQVKNEVKKELQIDEVVQNVANENKLMRQELFYLKNKEYDTPEVREFIQETGKDPADVVNSESFKKIFDKVKGYEKAQESANVLKSNSKTRSDDHVEKLSKAQSTGRPEDWAKVLQDRLG